MLPEISTSAGTAVLGHFHISKNLLYPGNPGLSVHLFDDIDSEWTETDVQGFEETNEFFKWSAVTEDAWIQSTPRQVASSQTGLATSDSHRLMADGWFVAPRTGYFKFITTNDDSAWWWINEEENKMCHFYGGGKPGLCGCETYTIPNVIKPETENCSPVSATKFFEKGDMMYMKLYLKDRIGVDFAQLGMVYLGDRLNEEANPVLPENVLLHKDFFLNEKQVFKISQTPAVDQVNFGLLAGENAAYEITLKYNDGIRTKTVNIDLENDSSNQVEDKILETIFSAECTYPSSISPWIKLDYEGHTWPHGNNMNGFQSVEPFCGRKFLDVDSSDGWKAIYHSDKLSEDFYLGSSSTVDLVQDADQINAICIAFYERLDDFRMRIDLEDADGRTLKNRWYTYSVNWVAPGGGWDYKCVNLKDLILSVFDDKYPNPVSLNLKELHVRNIESRGQTRIRVDDFILGYIEGDIARFRIVPNQTRFFLLF